MPVRRYTNLAPPLPLLSGINQTAPSLSVSSTSGYGEPPFLIGIERGTPNEEVVLCTFKTGTSFTVERGFDDTTGKVHDVGVIIEHVVAAIDYREAAMPRLTTAERDALLVNEIWNGRIIWNSTTSQLEVRELFEGWVDFLPAGLTLPFAGSALPKGWVWAQGQAISRTDYARLFAAISTAFGLGDGSTTFNVPDMRRRFPLGRHTSSPYNVLAATGGEMDHDHTNSPASSAGAHSHTQSATGSGGNHAHANSPTGLGGNHTHSLVWYHVGISSRVHIEANDVSMLGTGSSHRHAASSANPDTDVDGNHTHSMGSTGSTGAHTHSNPATSSGGTHTHNLSNTGTANPPFLVLNYIIKV